MNTENDDPAPPPIDRAGLGARVADEMRQALAQPLAPALYLVATPIGNLWDVSLRTLAVLANADRLYCEDTRQSAKLLARYAMSRRLFTYHEHNAAGRRPEIMAALAAGQSVALISDAGTPLVSDPGYKLARAAVEAGHPVHAVPGPSAVLAALTVSGLPTDTFCFAGFLPPRSAQRTARLNELAATPATLIFFETGPRLADALADIAALWPSREVAVARELTKLHEEILRGPAADLAAAAAAREFKGEIVLLLAPPAVAAVDDDAIRAALTTALANHSLRDAVKSVAEGLGANRTRVYALAVAMRT